MDAGRGGQVELYVISQDRQPSQNQQALGWRAQAQIGRHRQVLQIDVRLIEPVEEHQRVGTGLGQAHRHVGHR